MTPGTRCLLLGLGLAANLAGAAAAREDDPQIVVSESFLAAHPDLHWRNEGALAYQAQRRQTAFAHFRSAARYADKPSQAMLATMLWNGDGVPVDRALAYAWMDLAAERGYPDLLATRERYWQALDADERQRALEVGRAVYAEFGDAVAKPRLEHELLRARRAITGSRLGRVGTLSISLRLPDGRMGPTVDGSLYYAARYWEPKQYWQWQDKPWQPPPRGHVEVGPPVPAEAARR